MAVLKDMKKLCSSIVDPRKEKIAIAETYLPSSLSPIQTVTDEVDYAIPGNDDVIGL